MGFCTEQRIRWYVLGIPSELRLGKRCFEVLDVVYSIVRRHKQSGSFASQVYRCGICQWRLAVQTKDLAITT